VAMGDPLVRLDPTDAQLAVRQSEAALKAAQAELDLLETGSRKEEIASAEAELRAAEASLSQAAAQRGEIQAGATDAEIAAAEAKVAAALVDQRAALDAHDQSMKCYDVSGFGTVCPGLGRYEEHARFQLHAADEAVEAAEKELVALSEAADDKLLAAEAAVWAAAAHRDIAQAQLDLLRAGPTAQELAVAEAAVAQAEANLAVDQVALARTEVSAPFAGSVGLVDVRVGELVSQDQVLATIGDLAALRVETTDLDEIDVARVAVGQKAALTFDALPEKSLAGQVVRISPMAAPGSGGVHYTVVIEMDDLDPAIRWGMTAFVDIEVED